MLQDRTLVVIRERSFLNILDLALIVVRQRPWTIGITAFLGILPWAILNAWLTSGADEEIQGVLMLLLVALEAPLATAPLTIVLGGIMFRSRPSARQVAQSLFRQLGPLFLYQVLLRSFLITTFLLVWLIPSRLALLNEVILLERGTWWKVLPRCSDLSIERGGDLFIQGIGQLCFGALFVVAFWLATGNLIDTFHNDLTWVEPEWNTMLAGRGLVGLWIAVAFFSIARFLTYIDQRIRLEGWEVELRLRAIGRAMGEDQERW